MPRSPAHSRARVSRTARAFTIAALLGSGVGVVSIQWLTRNRPALGDPRLGRHENSPGAWKV